MFCLKDLHHIPNTETMKTLLPDRHKKYTFPKQILGLVENFICMNIFLTCQQHGKQLQWVIYLPLVTQKVNFSITTRYKMIKFLNEIRANTQGFPLQVATTSGTRLLLLAFINKLNLKNGDNPKNKVRPGPQLQGDSRGLLLPVLLWSFHQNFPTNHLNNPVSMILLNCCINFWKLAAFSIPELPELAATIISWIYYKLKCT